MIIKAINSFGEFEYFVKYHSELTEKYSDAAIYALYEHYDGQYDPEASFDEIFFEENWQEWDKVDIEEAYDLAGRIADYAKGNEMDVDEVDPVLIFQEILDYIEDELGNVIEVDEDTYLINFW